MISAATRCRLLTLRAWNLDHCCFLVSYRPLAKIKKAAKKNRSARERDVIEFVLCSKPLRFPEPVGMAQSCA